MDFGTILHKAQKNEAVKKEPIRYYSTKFEPPKKEQRNKSQLSVNIKKFLEKKEQEEQQKRLEAQRKKEELLSLRSKDKKAVRRVNVMMKRTKSANQSVIQDAVTTDDTAVTLVGPAQPDEDDYGYVSQEASAFYNKIMEKYSKLPEKPSPFSTEKKKVSINLNSTKDRVRAAIEKEREEAMMPHKRKRKHHSNDDKEKDKEERFERQEEYHNKPKPEKPKPKAPPPMNFEDLLKLAAKKQHEPIIIEKKVKEEEAPLTKKQKKELERVKEWQERRNDKNKQPPSTIPQKSTPATEKVPTSKADSHNKKPPKTEKPQQEPEKRPKIDWGPKHPGAGKLTQNNVVKPKVLPELTPKDKPRLPTTEPKRPSEPNLKPTTLNKPKEPPKPVPPKPKQFPPADVRRKPPTMKVNKGRILDDDDEDSEMDDFIDDGPEDEQDVSKYIQEIFGYNKSKYSYADEDDDDIMESSFAQQMKEEVISTKLGIMEDLEDMKMEEEHKKRKAMMKKKMVKSK